VETWGGENPQIYADIFLDFEAVSISLTHFTGIVTMVLKAEQCRIPLPVMLKQPEPESLDDRRGVLPKPLFFVMGTLITHSVYFPQPEQAHTLP